MANNCDFSIRITGKPEGVKELVAMMRVPQMPGDEKYEHLGRTYECGFELPETLDSGIIQIEGWGDCAWSVLCALRDYGGRHPSLESESERLGLVVEVYSSEPGCAFQEHVVIAKGEAVVDECVDYNEYDLCYYENLEAFNKENKTNFTVDMIEEDVIRVGGFENYGSFEDMSSYFEQEKSLFHVIWNKYIEENNIESSEFTCALGEALDNYGLPEWILINDKNGRITAVDVTADINELNKGFVYNQDGDVLEGFKNSNPADSINGVVIVGEDVLAFAKDILGDDYQAIADKFGEAIEFHADAVEKNASLSEQIQAAKSLGENDKAPVIEPQLDR